MADEEVSPAEKRKERVLILGGGLGGLCAAWALSNDEQVRKKFEVHVYQMGWRLGGKGRTGRDPKRDHRVIEHGLHAFGGYYHNTFRVLRACAGDEAVRVLLEPESRVAFPVDVPSRTPASPSIRRPVPYRWAPFEDRDSEGRPRLPGDSGRAPPTVADLIARMIVYLEKLDLFDPGRGAEPEPARRSRGPVRAMTGLARQQVRAAARFAPVSLAPEAPQTTEGQVEALLNQAAQVANEALRPNAPRPFPIADGSLGADPDVRRAHQTRSFSALNQLASETLGRLERIPERGGHRFRLEELEDETSLDERRALWRTITRVCLACVVGVLSSGADRKGLDSLNCLDFREFLRINGASHNTVDSGVVKGIYDYVFAYTDGEPDKPALAAGVAVRFMLLFFLDSAGGLQWNMTRGMGESVVLPLYETLKKNGVIVHFYREVTGLGISADGRRVENVLFHHQVPRPPIPTPDHDEYLDRYHVPAWSEPLSCWPLEPRAETLGPVTLEDLRAQARGRDDFGLEGSVPPAGRNTLEDEFDAVVLAIPPAAQRAWLPPALVALWGELTKDEYNVETTSVQIWTRREASKAPFFLVGSSEKIFPSVADMSHQLPYDRTQAHRLYFLVGQGRRLRHQANFDAASLAKEAYQDFIEQDTHGLPSALGLTDISSASPDVHAQRNQLPADLYCRSAPHTVNRRPFAHLPQVENLALAGDWVRTGLDFGCAEAAVLSGLQAANKIRRRAGLTEVETYLAGRGTEQK